MSKWVKWFLVLLLAVGLFPLANTPTAQAAYTVTLDNPGFESGFSPGWFQFITANPASVTTDRAHTGSKSLLLDDNKAGSGNQNSFGANSGRHQAAPGDIYRASVSVYLEPGAAGTLILAYFNAAGTRDSKWVPITGGAGQWQDITATLTAPDTTTHVGVQLISGSYQTGKTYFDDVKLEKLQPMTGNVTLQSNGAPLPWVKVNLYTASDTDFTTSLASAYTDINGAYALPDLQPGSYNVRASRNGYATQTTAFQVTSAAPTVNFALTVDPAYPPRAISGTVTDLTYGQPVAGASVGLFLEVDHQATMQIANVTTNAIGSYNFTVVAPSDRYFVKVEKTGYVTTREPVYVYDEAVTDADVSVPITPPVYTSANVPLPPAEHPRLLLRSQDISAIKAKRGQNFFQKSFEEFDKQRDNPGYTARSELATSASPNQTRTFTFPTSEQARYIRLTGIGNYGITNSDEKGLSISEIDVYKNGSGGAGELVTSAVTATSSSSCPNTLPGYAVDNLVNTYHCIPNAAGILTLDLLSNMNIHSLDIVFNKDSERVYLFNIEVSQNMNSGWKLVDTGMGSSDLGALPNVPDGNSNVIGSVLLHANANAFEYLLDPVQSLSKGQKAVAMALNLASSAEYSLSSNNGQTGPLLETMALVYDWCHPLLSEAQKDQIYNAIITFAGHMEMGYKQSGTPIFKNENVGTGHGGEGQLFHYLLGAAIAVYDKYPDIYNRVVPFFFNNVVPVRNYFYDSETHHQGNSYIGARFGSELWATMLFTRMGKLNPFSNNQGDVLNKQIYVRRPDGQWLRDGDEYFPSFTPLNIVWQDPVMSMLAASLFSNPYVKNDFLETFPFYKGYFPLYEILFVNDNMPLQAIPPYDLPRSHYFNDPEATMVARTGWDDVLPVTHQSSTVIAEMKIGNRRFGNHEHMDFGSFQIYYKGGLAIDSGIYEGNGTGWWKAHDVNYHKRTIAHNAMLVYDPNERPTSHVDGGNDGGQRWRDTGTSGTGLDADTMQNIFGSNFKFAEVQGRAFGPDPIVPNYTYIKGDLSPAYSAKVEQYQRSMMFLNLKNSTNPAAMIVFDRVVSSDKKFDKYWLLHSIEEPDIDNMTTTIRRTDKGDTGKLVNQTLLPLPGNASIVSVPGFDVFGNVYPAAPGSVVNNTEEQGGWRIQLSPIEEAKEDLFLNVLQVMDGTGTSEPQPLPIQRLDAPAMVGAQLADRAVLFSKSGKRLSGTVTLTTYGNEPNLQHVVTDLQEGSWKITRNGVDSFGTVSKEGGVLYFTGIPGTYTLTHMGNNSMTTVNVQLKDSSGNPLAGAVIEYEDAGWKSFGTTDMAGTASKTLSANSYKFIINYEGTSMEKTQHIGTDPIVTFETVNVKVQLKDGQGNPLSGVTASYYSTTGWRTFGVLTSGEANKQMLPGYYGFNLTYNGTNFYKEQHVGSEPVVIFQTVNYN